MELTYEQVIARFLEFGFAVTPPDPEMFEPPAGEWTITRISTNYTVTTGFNFFADYEELDAFIAFIDAQMSATAGGLDS